MTEPAGSTPGLDGSGADPRGYDRGQVEEHLRVLTEQVAELRIAHQREHRRAESAEEQLHRARTELKQRAAADSDAGQSDEASSTRGLGYQVEKLLRAAEDEADEVRAAASREATALLDRARGEADLRWRKMEQSLIQRTVQLDEREGRIAEHTAAAQDEVERMFIQARLQCDQLWLQARACAEREQAAAADAVRESRRSAEQELGRLHWLHDRICGQLACLLDSLAGEFGTTNPAPSSPPHPDSPTHADSPTQPGRVPPRRFPTGPESPPHPQPYPRSGRGGSAPTGSRQNLRPRLSQTAN